MKMMLLVDGKRLKIETPFDGADHAVVTGNVCPHCGIRPLKVAGGGRYPSKDDRAWEAEGFALCCRKHVGTIRVETDTLFGVREDAAVARMGARIY